MSTHIMHYVVWGVKLPDFDHDEQEELIDKYKSDRYSRKKTKQDNAVDDISLVCSGMDDFEYFAGHVARMADGYDGEGIDYISLPAIPEKADEWMQATFRLCEKLGLPKPAGYDFGWHVFTQWT
ncbi:hypothetical protein CC53_gp140 [Rhizobium phage vB_RleS_L338C]|uniref:hypothetical protein n=1 Tax=Rhizobium phage vB_RleS_L338C TaxID=1414737 RepID=UPI0003D8E818|nr:hypothetical protein CC53_gp140 [Rhizobium phage vB_RleS_L338C]AHC30557.1 hypothetical protein L338C_140 [Rhizobium phage vB_RleS_L338C]QNH72127.1 hypothetical protein P11VFA_009 [Rhizobium phage P11VFA]